MDTKAYRRKIEQSVAKVQARRPRAAARESVDDPRTTVRDKKVAAKTRAEMLGELTRAEGPDVVPDTALSVLADPNESAIVRLAAIKLLQQQQIFSPIAAEWRPAFVAGLRAAVADPKLRAAALEILSLFKDRPTQERLLEGIRKPKRALVPLPEALRLLSTDVHADVLDVARKLTTVAQLRKNKAAFTAALRILAADPSSVGKLEKVLANNTYPVDARRLAATAISHLAPDNIQPAPAAPQAERESRPRRGAKAAPAKKAATPKGALAKHLQTLQRVRE